MGRSNAVALFFFALFIALAPWMFGHGITQLIPVGIYALIAIGLSLLLGYAGQISLGHAAFYAIGAYASGVLTVRFEWNPWLAMAVAGILSVAVAALIAIPSLRLHGHYLAMATLAFGEIAFQTLNAWIPVTGGPSGFGGIPTLSIGSYAFTPFQRDPAIFYLVWAFVFLGLVVALLLIHSRVGRALRAIHDHEEAAAVLGINAKSYKIRIFLLSAVFASIAGSLYAHISGYINPPPFHIEWSILFVIMVIVGGMRDVWGAILGAALMGMLPEWLASIEDWRFVVYGIILLLIMMFLPQGLVTPLRRILFWLPEKIWRKTP